MSFVIHLISEFNRLPMPGRKKKQWKRTKKSIFGVVRCAIATNEFRETNDTTRNCAWNRIFSSFFLSFFLFYLETNSSFFVWVRRDGYAVCGRSAIFVLTDEPKKPIFFGATQNSRDTYRRRRRHCSSNTSTTVSAAVVTCQVRCVCCCAV